MSHKSSGTKIDGKAKVWRGKKDLLMIEAIQSHQSCTVEVVSWLWLCMAARGAVSLILIDDATPDGSSRLNSGAYKNIQLATLRRNASNLTGKNKGFIGRENRYHLRFTFCRGDGTEVR